MLEEKGKGEDNKVLFDEFSIKAKSLNSVETLYSLLSLLLESQPEGKFYFNDSVKAIISAIEMNNWEQALATWPAIPRASGQLFEDLKIDSNYISYSISKSNDYFNDGCKRIEAYIYKNNLSNENDIKQIKTSIEEGIKNQNNSNEQIAALQQNVAILEQKFDTKYLKQNKIS